MNTPVRTILAGLIVLATGSLTGLPQALADDPDAITVPEDMVLVPAGPFLMGNNNDYFDNDSDEFPQHSVDLPAFLISRYPVTNSDYRKFVEATGHTPPRFWTKSGEIPAGLENHPVVGVNYYDATAYAAWLGRRLPTEQEWEKAARGPNGRRWPWGNIFDRDKANVGNKTTSAVGSYPDGASYYGVLTLSGNVWEWTDTWYRLYPGSPPNRTAQRFIGTKVKSVRGGSYGSDIGSARGADRGIKPPADSGPTLGFRTALDVPGYEHYQDALSSIDNAGKALAAARPFVTDYEEHAPYRKLLREGEALLSEARHEFDRHRYGDSDRLARKAWANISSAHDQAVAYKRLVLEKKAEESKQLLDRLERALRNVSTDLTPKQQALRAEAEKHLEECRLFYEEGGWGYSQMHAYIGLRQVKQLPGN